MISMVSIIVPLYNAEVYLENCINSILKQSFDNFEVLLINDGSTDESWKICEKFKKADKRIRIFSQKNSGVSAARNLGLKNAIGEYITFLDSDDYWGVDFLKNLMDVLSSKVFDWIISGITITHKDFKSKKTYNELYIPVEGEYTRKEILEKLQEEIPFIILSSPCAKIYKKTIIYEKQLFFDETVTIGEDCLFNLEYLRWCLSDRIIIKSYTDYYYLRLGNGSLFNSFHPEIMSIQNKIHEKIFILLDLFECSDLCIKKIYNVWAYQNINSIASFFKEKYVSKQLRLNALNKMIFADRLKKCKINVITSRKIRTIILLAKLQCRFLLYTLFLIQTSSFRGELKNEKGNDKFCGKT